MSKEEGRFRRVVPNRISVKHLKFGVNEENEPSHARQTRSQKKFQFAASEGSLSWSDGASETDSHGAEKSSYKAHGSSTCSSSALTCEVHCAGFILEVNWEEGHPRGVENILYKRTRQAHQALSPQASLCLGNHFCKECGTKIIVAYLKRFSTPGFEAARCLI